jgi:hypothetical protein
MSGVKYSTIQLQQQQQERQDALSRIQQAEAQALAVRQSIQAVLAGIPEGVKSAFAADAAAIQA